MKYRIVFELLVNSYAIQFTIEKFGKKEKPLEFQVAFKNELAILFQIHHFQIKN
jgi:hypothetical protein